MLNFFSILNGSCIKVTGTLVESPNNAKKDKEVQVSSVVVIGACSEEVSNTTSTSPHHKTIRAQFLSKLYFCPRRVLRYAI